MIVTMTMPIILTREMTPNGRYASVNARSAVTKRLRRDAFRATMTYVNDPRADRWFLNRDFLDCEPVALDVEIEWPKGRKRLDPDNAWATMKPVIDGISDALWGSRDSHVQVGKLTQTRGGGGLVITLRTGEDAA